MKQILRISFVLLLMLVVALQVYTLVSSGKKSRRVQVCPTGAISMRNSKAVIDSAKCIGCQRCVTGLSLEIPLRTEAVAAVVEQSPSKPQASEQAADTHALEHRQEQKIQKPPIKADKIPVNEQTSHAYAVIPDKCIGCQLCVAACPTQAISMVDGKAVIDKEKCINCGICVKGNGVDFQGCPVQAIKAPLNSQLPR